MSSEQREPLRGDGAQSSAVDPGTRWVYPFEDGSAEMRELLGNKGANLAEMTRVLGPDKVPGGFTISTAACVEYMRGDGRMPAGLEAQIADAVSELERANEKRFGDPDDPLLISVRSGAPVSMPGMLDTILNLGLTGAAVDGLAARTGNGQFAWDSRRRLVQMFSEVAKGVDAMAFEQALTEARQEAGVAADSDLDEGALGALVERFLALYARETGEDFPDDPQEQLRLAVKAVFDSWNNDRAVTYRRLNGIPDDLGTAVTVQRMVFGNLGPSSGAGVAFTRDPTDGTPRPDGDFLVNAQGEDVVAGVRNTEDLDGLARRMPDVHAELLESLARLERHYRDIQDVEYTVEEGRLFILQTRNAKRHALAAVRFAVDAVVDGLLDRAEALRKVDPGSLAALLHPSFDPADSPEELTRGVPASPGAARGKIVLSASEAEAKAAEGEDVILVRPFTSADDVGGFHAARGILTAQGGKSSHAAIVARGMGRPCVCGASALEIDPNGADLRIGDKQLHPGDLIAIDGSSGVVTADEVRLVPPQVGGAFSEVLAWSDELRRLGVRANADTGEDAARARELGAEGIGLCRTEHMFFGHDREQLVREMFIAGERSRREHPGGDPEGDGGAAREFARSLERLGELQRADFVEIFRAMTGLPVTIRLLDPPIHEFIDVASFEHELERAEESEDADAIRRARANLDTAHGLQETNPMLGTRGARLGLVLPGLYRMQVRAVIEAALEVGAQGDAVRVEIMLPLIAYESELVLLKKMVESAAKEALQGRDGELEVEVGTMIELPRACLAAGAIAQHAGFFSFGTNDLTQTALGLSRDDAERGFLPDYIARNVVARSPFETIDTEGVGELVKTAVDRGRAARPGLTLGICGEHGGDPDSIDFFHAAGLDYVSCSPYRVPVARVAAARAAIGD
jgi:pyruvate,orthophosphate dikinase